PTMPGAFSAYGMLQGDVRHDTVQTFYRALDGAGDELATTVDGLQQKVSELLEVGTDFRYEAAADLRYVGQEYTLTLPLSGAEVDKIDDHAGALRDRFHTAYHERYGHASETEPVEFVAIRVAAIAPLDRPVNGGSSNGHHPATAQSSGTATY